MLLSVRSIVLSGFMGFVFGLSAQDDSPRKKFIELGWDIPDTAYLKAHHEAMQQTTPFDGVMLALDATAPDGKKHSSQRMMDAQAWDPAWFATATADLKACRWTTFTDNFIRVNFSPGQVEWDDDTGWANFCGKTRLCATIAKDTGLRGLAVDFEPYGKAIFRYAADAGRSFEETKAVVRMRGRQWMEAMASPYPDMVLFTLFIADVNVSAGYDARPDNTLKSLHYGLLPAFFNGMLDAAPPKMRIVDGCETGYYKNGFDEFARTALAIQSIGGPAIRLVAPENREKYVAQVQVSFGFYLDMYTNPEGNVYYRGPKEGGTRLDRLEENLTAARETADVYVWIYGEKQRWWKPSDPAVKWQHWEDALPGVSQTIRFAKNPAEAAHEILGTLRKEDRGVNLLTNPDFTDTTGWSFWQHEPLGTFEWDNGSGKLSNVKRGCILQSVQPVKPGEYYYVALDSKQQGGGQTDLRIRWQNADRQWVLEAKDRLFSFEADPVRLDGRPLPGGWSRAEGIVRIPEGAAVLQVQAGVKEQVAGNSTVWVDNAVLIRLR
ncbi:MAG: hypothetical protein FWH21_03495 [Kiritimatiellaeota bacterium]|nr:hypothetical protein [Kiritimatiellota bacterium]